MFAGPLRERRRLPCTVRPCRLDEEAADEIHPNNTKAGDPGALEYYHLTGQKDIAAQRTRSAQKRVAVSVRPISCLNDERRAGSMSASTARVDQDDGRTGLWRRSRMR